MYTKAIATGLLGLLCFAAPAFADPPLASTEKAYQLLQTIASQLQEVQTRFAPTDSAPAAALAKAQEQVRIAAAHYCHALCMQCDDGLLPMRQTAMMSNWRSDPQTRLHQRAEPKKGRITEGAYSGAYTKREAVEVAHS